VRVTEDDTDLGGCEALAGKFYDVIYNIIGGCLEPCRGSAAVREGRGRCKELSGYYSLCGQNSARTNALAGSVHATHGELQGKHLASFRVRKLTSTHVCEVPGSLEEGSLVRKSSTLLQIQTPR
jgi:hypothetical protein